MADLHESADLPENIGRWQPVALAFLRPLFKFFWRMEVTGLEHLPTDGPAVICPNHMAAIDSFILPTILPRGIQYVGKSEYLDDWKTAKVFPALGMIPIDRRGGDHATAALDAARQVLKRGGLFGIYPEGTRSRSGKLHKGHTGAARLAIETGAPIVPVGMIGTVDIQPPNQSLPNFFRSVKINIGKPIDVSRYRERVGDRAVYRQVIDEVMFEIQSLCGQDYEDTYAGVKKTVKTAEVANTATSSAPMKGRPLETHPRPATTRPASVRPTTTRGINKADGPVIERKSSSDVLGSRPLATLG